MRIYKHGFCVFLLILSMTGAHSQEFLVLEKTGTKKRHEYYSGDEIIFKLNDEDGFRSDEILSFQNAAIIFESGSVPLKDIEKVSLSNKSSPWKGIGGSLIVAGLGYMLIDLFNKTISSGDVYIDEKVARSAGILVASGFLLKAVGNKRVSLKKNWRLRIVDI